MTSLLNKIWLAIVFMVLVSNAGAQQPTVSITSGGFASVSGQLSSAPLSTQNPIGQTLAANLNFGDVGATGGQRRISITMPIRISAATNYKIEIQRSGITGSGIKASDIGFGISNIRPQQAGSNLTGDAANISIIGNFSKNPKIAPIINGVPKFDATLADISESATTVLTGVPTVASGNLGDDDTSILADLTFVIVPQYFDVSDGSNIMLTISITPL